MGHSTYHSNFPAFSILYDVAFLLVGLWVLTPYKGVQAVLSSGDSLGREATDDWGGWRESSTVLDPF